MRLLPRHHGARLFVSVFLLCIPHRVVGQDIVVRTADMTVRGLSESDFPRIRKLAENVYGYEQKHPSVDFTTNSLIVVTSDGVLVADGQMRQDQVKRMIADIAIITTQPIKYVVVCSDHLDHIAGNGAFPNGVTFIAHPTSKATIEEAVKSRPKAPRIPIPTEMVPDKRILKMGNTEIHLLHLGRAHTGGDLLVHLPREGILFTGEVSFNRVYPSIGSTMSGRPVQWLETVKRIESMNVPIPVPGHGFIDSPQVLREEFVNMRRVLENLVFEGRRLHSAKVPIESAIRSINLGEFQYWYRAANNMPDALRMVYMDLEGNAK